MFIFLGRNSNANNDLLEEEFIPSILTTSITSYLTLQGRGPTQTADV